MAANATTKIQVSYGKDGSLVNIYADTALEAEKLLASVQDMATLIESVGASLGRNNVKPVQGAINYARKALGATPIATTNNAGEEQITDKFGTVWTYGKSDAPDCINGKMIFASGTSQKGKPYKGWFDPMKGPKPMHKPEGYAPVDPIFIK
jgi:hypothetical protein